MKAEDIKKFRIGEHCFGPILEVNDKRYEEISKEDILEFINDRFENDINSDILIQETFKNLLEHLQYDFVEGSNDVCDQCGNWNFSEEYHQ